MQIQVIQKAWDNTWETVIGQPISTIMIAVLTFLIAFGLARKYRGKEYAKDWLFDAVAGVSL
ncbi:MAG TPA: hypothetical protein VE344_04310 [Methylomirabilota bacterium]|nr:hypothetical protein [Methylomirabilota bacterium]